MIRILIGLFLLAVAVLSVAHFRANQPHGNLIEELTWGSTTAGQCFYTSSLRDGPPPSPIPLRFWECEQVAGLATAHAMMTPDGLDYNIQQVAGSSDQLQLFTVAITLKPNHKYRVGFSAKADKPRKIAVQDNKNGTGGDYGAMDLYSEFSIDTTWSDHDITFIPKQVDGLPDRFPVFLLGQTTGKVDFKHITVDETD